MINGTLKGYVEGRYSDLLNYYDKRAIKAKLFYNLCAVYVILISVAIAPLAAIASDAGKIIVAFLSPTLALVTGIAAHFKFHENWLNYRGTWAALKRELALLEANAGYYRSAADRDTIFVERVEAMVANEAQEFYSSHVSQASATATVKTTI